MAEPLESETSELFKQAFGHHPAGVAVITATDDAGEPAGLPHPHSPQSPPNPRL